jgi:hypothetical protein
VRWGVWGNWDYKFDYEYMWDNNHKCFCGGEGHGDTVPGVPGYDEACGNESTATCAAEMATKVVQTPGPDMNRCAFGHDTDQDGYPDGLDCDSLNPYLRLDTDGDGWCDTPAEGSWAWPLPGSGDQLDVETECLQTCNLIYGRLTDTPTANTYLVRCTKNCTLPEPDNCIDLTYEACAAVLQGILCSAADQKAVRPEGKSSGGFGTLSDLRPGPRNVEPPCNRRRGPDGHDSFRTSLWREHDPRHSP